MKSALFFDIDGTLRGRDRIIPESTIRGISEAQAKGNLCFINSGRPLCMVYENCLEIPWDGILAGGGSYIKMGDRVILDRELPEDLVREMMAEMERLHILYQFQGRDWIAVPPSDPRGLRAAQIEMPAIIIDPEDVSNVHANKMCAMPTLEQMDGMREFGERFKEYFQMIVLMHPQTKEEMEEIAKKGGWASETGFVEMIPWGYNKGTSVVRVMEELGLPMSQSYIFGDAANDLEMFEVAGTAICMGNGDDIAKSAADYVTDTILNDGIYKAMQHFDLV